MYDTPGDSSRRIRIRSTVSVDNVTERSLSVLAFGRILPGPFIIAASVAKRDYVPLADPCRFQPPPTQTMHAAFARS